VQLFLKRLRKAIEPRIIRYFLCGEYGEKYGRPHYHALIFGLARCSCGLPDERQNEKCGCKDRDTLLAAWGKGGVAALGSVEYKSARYTAEYVIKDQLYDWKNDPRTRPFILYSKGLGRDYADFQEEQWRERKGVTLDGIQVGLPRYYAKRLGIKYDPMEKKEEGYEEPARSKIAHVWVGPAYDALLDDANPRQAREAEHIARQKLFKKGSM